MCDQVFISFYKELYNDEKFMGLLRSLRPTLSLEGDCDIACWDNPYATAIIMCDLSKRGQRANDIINWFGLYKNRMKFQFFPDYESNERRIAEQKEYNNIEKIENGSCD
jgi:hypothetical protein